MEVLNPQPRMVLVAQEFHARTWRAIDFLNSSGTVVETREVTVHTGDDGETIVEVQGAELPVGTNAPSSSPKRFHYGVTLADLLQAGLLVEGEDLRWERPRLNSVHVSQLLPGGVGLKWNGSDYSTPSAAGGAAGERSVDGWEAWRVLRAGEWVRLNELRRQYLEASIDPESS